MGGALKLNAEKARRVFEERIARPLGMTIEQAAYGALCLQRETGSKPRTSWTDHPLNGVSYLLNSPMLPDMKKNADQFVYGSAFPFGNIDVTLQQTLKLPISEATMRKYLYENGAALLKL